MRLRRFTDSEKYLEVNSGSHWQRREVRPCGGGGPGRTTPRRCAEPLGMNSAERPGDARHRTVGMTNAQIPASPHPPGSPPLHPKYPIMSAPAPPPATPFGEARLKFALDYLNKEIAAMGWLAGIMRAVARGEVSQPLFMVKSTAKGRTVSCCWNNRIRPR